MRAETGNFGRLYGVLEAVLLSCGLGGAAAVAAGLNVCICSVFRVNFRVPFLVQICAGCFRESRSTLCSRFSSTFAVGGILCPLEGPKSCHEMGDDKLLRCGGCAMPRKAPHQDVLKWAHAA